MTRLDVSVVIPTHNRARELTRALRSVAAQSVPPREVIVVDDGSVDETPHVMKSQFPWVRYIRQRNRGVSRARNAGIEIASGEWLAFLDSDDTWFPDKLERQHRLLGSRPRFLWCHTDEIWIRRGQRVNPMDKHAKQGGSIFMHCLARCVVSPSTVLIRREMLDAVGLFDETLPACEDYDLWLRISAHFPIAFCSSPLITKFGGHADQLSRRYWGMDRFRIRSLEKLIAGGTLTPRQSSAARAELLRKIRIVLAGARKRANRAMIECYGAKWAHLLSACSAEEPPFRPQ